jgi:hypothetical protein
MLLLLYTKVIILLMSMSCCISIEWEKFTQSTDPCQNTCENCGKNSARCIFNPIKCTINCECKPGFIGDLCLLEEVQTTEETTIVFDFRLAKEQIWSSLLAALNNKPSITFYNSLFKNLSDLFDGIKRENDLNPHDINRLTIILDNLLLLNTSRLVLSEKSIFYLFETINIIIDMNGHVNNRDVLAETNRKFNNSALNLFFKMDNLIRYFDLKSSRLHVKQKMFNSLLIDTSRSKISSNQVSMMELTSNLNVSENQTADHHHYDTISLNPKILMDVFGNRTLKIGFKIYFNYEDVPESVEKKEMKFYDHLKEISRNFFYEITQLNANETLVTSSWSANYFVSSNILSAVIFNDEMEQSEITNAENLVRIQFMVDLKCLFNQTSKIDKHLVCVFWNHTSMVWSSQGCHTSIQESHFIENELIYKKVCYCDHLTNFALLFDASSSDSVYVEKASFFKEFLTYLTYIGISVSCICYLVLILSRLACFQNYSNSENSSRPSYHDNALRRLYLSNAACLLISNILFLFVLKLKPTAWNLNVCVLIASMLHFFLLASFCFSFATAWHHYTKLVKIFANYGGNFFSKNILILWMSF